MSSNDPSSDLDSRIAAVVEKTISRVRDELMHRLEDTESRLRSVADRLGTDVAAEPVSEPVPEPPAGAPAAGGEAVSALFDAVAAIDRGNSQQEVLAALLEGLGRFAGRSALFLTRADGAQGWGSYGFEDLTGEIQDVVLSYDQGPLAVLAEGRGCVALSAEECRDLCARIGASPGTEGLLVPFVLRDRLAAALYADRSPDDAPLAHQQLQLLAYVGSLAVESLTLRQRNETPTLQVASADAEAPGVALWEAPAAEAAEPAAEEAVPPPPPTEPPPTEPQPAEPEPTEPQLSEPQLSEPQPIGETVIEGLVEPVVEPVVEERVTEELPLPEAPAETVSEAPATEPEPAVGDEEWQLPTMPEELAQPAAEPEPAPEEEPARPFEAPAPPAEEATAMEAPAAAATGGDELATAEAEPHPAPAEPAPLTEEEAAGAPSGSTEVRPPTDVSGPGWAFTASRAATESSDDSQHEEARRLARLLVTEIKLYNEEQVEEGRRGKDIYARLREDIDRSRQIFNERVEAEVREQTDYFHEEMVRILAGGNEEALGL